jgi:hypothetical protein
MPRAEACVPTDRAARYLDQLCSHLDAMQHMRRLPAGGHARAGMPRVEYVAKKDGRAEIRFADGSWDLEAVDGALVLRVEADGAAALERLKAAIAARIEKVGRRDGLAVVWSSPESPHDDHGNGAGGAGAAPRRPGRRPWRRRIGWFALAALAVAIHLGLIGALLGGGRWKDVAAETIIAVIAVKLVLLALHARPGRSWRP